MLRDLGALRVIIPQVGNWLEQTPPAEREIFWRHLEALDALLTAAVHGTLHGAGARASSSSTWSKPPGRKGGGPGRRGGALRSIPLPHGGDSRASIGRKLKRICSMQKPLHRTAQENRFPESPASCAQETSSRTPWISCMCAVWLVEATGWEVYTRNGGNRDRGQGNRARSPRPFQASLPRNPWPSVPTRAQVGSPPRRSAPRSLRRASESPDWSFCARKSRAGAECAPGCEIGRPRKPATSSFDPNTRPCGPPWRDRCVVPTQEEREIVRTTGQDHVRKTAARAGTEGDEPVWLRLVIPVTPAGRSPRRARTVHAHALAFLPGHLETRRNSHQELHLLPLEGDQEAQLTGNGHATSLPGPW